LKLGNNVESDLNESHSSTPILPHPLPDRGLPDARRCRFEAETLWLTQAQMAELFQVTPQNVTLHLKAIFAEGELVGGNL
jgi:hypothetical protein